MLVQHPVCSRRWPDGTRRPERLANDRRVLPLILILESQAKVTVHPDICAGTHIPTDVPAVPPPWAALREGLEEAPLWRSQSHYRRRAAGCVEVSVAHARG